MTVEACLDEIKSLEEKGQLHENRRKSLLWSSQNERDELAKIAIAAWNNCTVENMPPTWHGHTCEATKNAWARVGEAIATYVRNNNNTTDK